MFVRDFNTTLTSPLALSIGFDADTPASGGDSSAPAPTPSLMDAPPAQENNDASGNSDDAAGDSGADGDGGSDDAADGGDDSSAADGADDGDDSGDGGDDEGDKPEGAPEEYADFTAPEGVELDAETLEAFKPIAKELNLTQEQAQKLVDAQSAQSQRWAEAVQQHVIDTRTQWRADAQADETIGGEKFGENLALAKAGRDAFGDDDFKALLDETGIGDHPAMIRMLYRVGRANSEHDFVNTGKPEQRKSFYDHPTSGPKG